MKLNKEKFMKTEMGGELKETIRTWDKAIDERRKATPGISVRKVRKQDMCIIRKKDIRWNRHF